MRARGYCPELLEQAKFSTSRGSRADELCEQIAAAFAGVRLGRGIGLRQGCAIDDYEDHAVQMARRAEDEEEDWQAISVSDLRRYASSLSYFDPEGTRFHLPAFLIAELRKEGPSEIIFYLTRNSAHACEQFSLLDLGQRQAVADYLRFVQDDPDHFCHRREILASLETYWAEAAAGDAAL